MIEIRITGFKNFKQAQQFVNWYQGQGEQDITVWLEESDCGCTSLYTVKTESNEKDGLIQMYVEPA